MTADVQKIIIEEMLLMPYQYKDFSIPRLPLIKEIEIDHLLYSVTAEMQDFTPTLRELFALPNDIQQKDLLECFLFWQKASQSFIKNPELVQIFGKVEAVKTDEKRDLSPVDYFSRHFLYEKIIRIYGFEAVQQHSTNYLSFLLRIHESEKAVDNLSLRDLLLTVYAEGQSGKLNRSYTDHLVQRASGILFSDKKALDEDYRKRAELSEKIKKEYWNDPEFRGLSNIKKAAFIKQKVNERLAK